MLPIQTTLFQPLPVKYPRQTTIAYRAPQQSIGKNGTSSQGNYRCDPSAHTVTALNTTANDREIFHARCFVLTPVLPYWQVAEFETVDSDHLSLVQDHEPKYRHHGAKYR